MLGAGSKQGWGQSPCETGTTTTLCLNDPDAIILGVQNSTITFQYGNPGHNYGLVSWYSCTNLSYANSSFLNDGLTTNWTPGPTGTYYLYYIASQPVAPNSTCTSGVYTVNYNVLDVSNSNTHVSANTTLSVSGNPANFSNYRWQRNGTPIPGATSSSYTPALPGRYQLKIDNAQCVDVVSNPIDVECTATPDISYSANHTFSSTVAIGTPVQVTTIKFGGDFTIPAGIEITFENAQIEIAGGNCTKGVIEGEQSTGDGGKLNLINCTVTTCNGQNKWKGIEVYGKVDGNSTVEDGKFQTSDNCKILDADIAVYATDEGFADIDETLFQSNRCHIVFEDVGLGGGEVTNSGFLYLMDNGTSYCSANGTGFSSSNSNIDRYVYLENSTLFIGSGSTMDGTKVTGNDLYAIEAYNGTSGNVLDLTNLNIIGDFDKGVYIENCEALSMINSSINGNILVQLHIEGGSGAWIQGSTFSYSGAGSNTSAIILNQAQNVSILGHTNVSGFTNGIEIYTHTANADIVLSQTHFFDCTYGIVIAPDCHPVTGGCNNSTNYGVDKDVTIYCCKLFYNDWGIIGTGDLIDQGSPGEDWNTFFEDEVVFDNATSSNIADLAWYKTGSKAKFYYWHDYDAVLNQHYYYDPIWDQTATTIDLDGHNVDHNNLTANYADFIVTSNSTECGFYKIDPRGNNGSKISKYEVYPNPFTTELRISNPYDKQVNITILDMTGRVVHSSLLKINEVNLIDTESFASGLYLMKLIDAATGVLMTTQKLVKTNP